MKHFDRLLLAIPLLFLLLIAVLDYVLLSEKNGGRQYLVDANRIEQMLLAGESPAADDFPAVTDISVYDGSAEFFRTDGEYLIREIGGVLYRIGYAEQKYSNLQTVLTADAALLAVFTVIMAVLIYIRQNILKQFLHLGDVPYQLAKGNLTESLKENKSRFFGKFVWGLDMLRGTLEQSKADELERAKQEKTMLLSLSHDIKTPLSAIKLYAKGISRGLFSGEEKLSGAADSINTNADEIERYLNEIIRNLHNDFMKFEVHNSEFYLSQVMRRITAYYQDKLSVSGTEFAAADFADCMLSGDSDRLEEVLQNIIENAVKYGDGKRIAVTFSDEEDCRLITVTNTGCTLPDEEAAHIFESFWRGSNANNKPGSGLGLYICSRLMKEMGGDIFAERAGDEMQVTVVCKKSG